MFPQVISGARCVLSINGTPYGAGSVLSYSLGTEQMELHTIDDPLPAELVPDKIRVALNVRIFRTPTNDPAKQAVSPATDPVGVYGVDQSYTQSNYLTVELRDKVTDTVLLYIPKAMVTRRTGDISAESLLTENLSLVGIGFYSNKSQSAGFVPTVNSL